MNVTELNREQLTELKKYYYSELVNEGTFAEVVGRDYKEPSYDDLVNVDEIVTDDVIFDRYGDMQFSQEDFETNDPEVDEVAKSVISGIQNLNMNGEPSIVHLRHGYVLEMRAYQDENEEIMDEIIPFSQEPGELFDLDVSNIIYMDAHYDSDNDYWNIGMTVSVDLLDGNCNYIDSWLLYHSDIKDGFLSFSKGIVELIKNNENIKKYGKR